MTISSRTPEGAHNRCPVCSYSIQIEPSVPPGDAPCPKCGSLIWFNPLVSGANSDVSIHTASLPNLAATNKPGAIREMVSRLSIVRAIEPEFENEIVESVLNREELGSTGIGNSVAVPHAKHASIKSSVGAMAVSQCGIDFSSLDRQPVHLVFLLVSPPDQPQEHLLALERISQYLNSLHWLPP